MPSGGRQEGGWRACLLSNGALLLYTCKPGLATSSLWALIYICKCAHSLSVTLLWAYHMPSRPVSQPSQPPPLSSLPSPKPLLNQSRRTYLEMQGSSTRQRLSCTATASWWWLCCVVYCVVLSLLKLFKGHVATRCRRETMMTRGRASCLCFRPEDHTLSAFSACLVCPQSTPTLTSPPFQPFTGLGACGLRFERLPGTHTLPASFPALVLPSSSG